jgi:hypothetical protein
LQPTWADLLRPFRSDVQGTHTNQSSQRNLQW